jgi:hypothetical protein
MHRESHQLTDETNKLTDVRSEQVRILFSSTPASLITIFINSLILAVVQWEIANHNSLVCCH